MLKPLICTYTNKVKSYCDKEFLENLHNLSKGYDVLIVVNDNENQNYYEQLCDIIVENYYTNFSIHNLIIPREPIIDTFQRNVAISVNKCRDIFLEGDYDTMIIIESDVIPPVNLLDTLKEDIKLLKDHYNKWGIVGGLYYKGFHNYNLFGLQKTHHVLSGCTVYKRELIEKYPFRYDPNNLAAFPDAIICFDSGNEYDLYNDHNIICRHLEIFPGCRQKGSL